MPFYSELLKDRLIERGKQGERSEKHVACKTLHICTETMETSPGRSKLLSCDKKTRSLFKNVFLDQFVWSSA